MYMLLYKSNDKSPGVKFQRELAGLLSEHVRWYGYLQYVSLSKN